MVTASSGRQLIDEVIYLASLVSNPRAIDSWMDTVRMVTATLPPSGEPEERQKAELLDLKHKLENYLLNQESVRVFTPESLELQLENYISGGTTKRAIWQLAGVSLIALFVTGLVALLTTRMESGGIRTQIIGTTFFALLHIGAAWLFLSALASFTTRLRVAFRWICAGIVLLGVALLLQPVIELLGLRGTVWSSFLGLGPALIPAVIVLFGARLYARLFGQSPRIARLGTILIAIFIMSVLTLLVPHAPGHLSLAQYWIVMSVQGATFLISLASAILLYSASLRMSDLYQKPTLSLTFAASVASLVSLYTYVFRIIFGGLTPGLATWFMIGLVSVMGFAFLYSGYVFNKASRY